MYEGLPMRTNLHTFSAHLLLLLCCCCCAAVWDSTNSIIWSSNTGGRGVGPRRFMVQDSGYALIVDARGEITWYAPTYAGGRKLLR